MADGDITAIEELGRLVLPHGGFVQATGVPSNSKIIVWGRITATYAAAGIDLLAAGGTRALGVLDDPDVLDFVPRQGGATATANPTDNNLFLADFKPLTDKIFIVDQEGQANPAVPTPSETFTIDYFAIGEDARKAVDHG